MTCAASCSCCGPPENKATVVPKFDLNALRTICIFYINILIKNYISIFLSFLKFKLSNPIKKIDTHILSTINRIWFHWTFSKNGCSKHFLAVDLCLKSKTSIFLIKSKASHVALALFPSLINSWRSDAFSSLMSPFSNAIRRSKQMFYFLWPFFSVSLFSLMYFTTYLVPTNLVILRIWSILSVPWRKGVLLKIWIKWNCTIPAKMSPADQTSTLKS